MGEVYEPHKRPRRRIADEDQRREAMKDATPEPAKMIKTIEDNKGAKNKNRRKEGKGD